MADEVEEVVEQEQDQQQEQDTKPEGQSDGPGSGRGELRKQLEASAEQERKGREKREAKPKESIRKTVNHQVDEEADEPEQTEAEGEEQPKDAEAPKEKVPDAFAKEAKAEWARTPAPVRAAILKREQDMAKGVQELRQRYTELDQVLSPRVELFRRHGHTPAAAVNQMFLWFDALANSPDKAFPALAESFKFDLKQLSPQGQAAGQEPQQQEQPQTEPWKQEFEGFKGQLQGQLQQLMGQFQSAQMAKTQETLDVWSKDKPHFEEVRQMMAQLVNAGQGLREDRSVDLDKVYDMALYALPEVRQKVLAEQEATKEQAAKAKADAERKAQKEQAEKARRASGGALRTEAPGNPPPKGAKGKGKTVAESLRAAIEEARTGGRL